MKWILRKIEKKPDAVLLLIRPRQNDFVLRHDTPTDGRQTRNFTTRNGIVMGYKSERNDMQVVDETTRSYHLPIDDSQGRRIIVRTIQKIETL